MALPIRLLPIIALFGAMPAAAEKPNVVLIITDDQGYGDMSCHGNPVLQTPNLDKLHAGSVRLVDFHVDPMCAPTRAALMTGRYSARTGVWSTLNGCYIPRRTELTLGHVFADAGYATAMLGKWHLGDTWPYEDWWKEMTPGHSKVSRLVVGSEHENPVLLTCHSWRTPSREMSYSQMHVRKGIMINDAWWPVEVARDGRYRIELRRRAREADASLGDSIPKIEQPFCKTLPEGRAFEIIEASLKVGDYDNTIPVKPVAKAAVFEVDLKKEYTRLQTRFKTDTGESTGAYYVYVERISP